ncbi:MAG: pantetheine-phosphate adenylyltransferase [Hyphomicrobiales bacterium]
MALTGFYPGSFDPVTNGHMDIITRAAKLVDKLVIGVGVHHGKKPLFSDGERLAMLKELTAPVAKACGAKIELTTFDNLTVDAARAAGATVMIRGLRDGTDLDYEMQLAGMNGDMAKDIETMFLAASPGVRHVTATIVRQIASMGGDTSPFVPKAVNVLLKAKF